MPPRPPDLQIQAEVDMEGNWFYPNADQANHDLRIQCEAFRAGVASRSEPFSYNQNPRQSSLASPRAPPRKIVEPVSRRPSRPVRSKPVNNRRKKKTSIAQICVCHKDVSKVKRPANAFVIFRSKLQPQLVKAVENDPSPRGYGKDGRGVPTQAAVSALASKWWKECKDRGEHKQYEALAEAEKVAHAARNPGFKYQPGLKRQLRWGDESCTCGAYQANEAKRRRSEAERSRSRSSSVHSRRYNDEDDENEEDQSYPPYPFAIPLRGTKRPGSRTSFEMQPPSKRTTRGYTVTETADTGYAAGSANSSVFPTESYGGDYTNAAYGGGGYTDATYGGDMADDTLMYDIPPTANMFDRQRSHVPRTQSGAGISPTAGRRPSRRSTVGRDAQFPIDYQDTELTEEDLLNMVAGLDNDNDGGQYNAGTPQNDQFTYTADQQQVQDERQRTRRASGGSFDSLFDMDGYDEQKTSPPRRTGSKRSSRGGPSSPRRRRRSSRRS